MAAYAENVYVITTDSYNEETYVECEYVANEDAWIGTYDYTAFEYAPVSVTAAYHEAFDVAITVLNEMLEYGEAYFEELNETLEEFIQVGDMESTTLLYNSSDGSEDKLVHYIVNDDEDDEVSYDIYSYYTVSSISSDSSVDYTGLVYIEYGDGNEVYYDYVVNDDEDVITLIIYDVSNDTKYTIYGSGNISSVLNEAGIESSSVDMAEFVLDESVLADMSTLGNILGIGAIALGVVGIGLVIAGAGALAVTAVGIVSLVAGIGSMIETDKDMDKIGEKLKKYKELNPSCYDEMSVRLCNYQSGNRAFGFFGALLGSGSVANVIYLI